jgi:branched-chain amino acid transport system substrate-binding protein
MELSSRGMQAARRGRLPVLAMGFVLLFTACGSTSTGPTASAPGITATTITIGSTQPLTGPAAPGYSEISKASDAYFQWVNDHGGVNGRKIVYKYEDDGYNPTKTTDLVRKQVLQDKVFAEFNGLGTPTHLAVIDYLNTEKVPDLFVASGCNCWNQPSKYPETFGWQTDYTIEGKILGQYINKNLAGKTVGYLSQGDEFGDDGVKGLDQKIASTQVVSRQKYDPAALSVTGVKAQIAALAQAKAQVVVLYTIPAATALALLTAVSPALNYHPTWVVSSVGADVTTLTGLLQTFSKGAAGAALLEGIVSGGYLPAPTNASDPWISLFQQIHDKYIPSLPMDGNVEYGMAVAFNFVDLMKKAGQNPTRQDVINTLNGGTVSRGAGLVPLGYSSSSHLGFTGEQIFVVTGGKATAQGSVYTSTDDGPINTYTGGELTPPGNGIP